MTTPNTHLPASDPENRARLARFEHGPNPAMLYLARLSDGSIPTQKTALRTLMGLLAPGLALDPDTFPWHAILPEQAVAVRARLVRDYAPSTARRILSALRGVVYETWRLGLLTSDQRDRICDLPSVKGDRPKTGRMLTQDEEGRLWQVASTGEKAMLTLLLGAGLRVEEACTIRLCDIEYRPAAQIRLRVKGKGNKIRHVYLHDRYEPLLTLWQNLRGGNHLTSPILKDTPRQLRSALKSLCIRAGIPPATPHDCRRTYASRALAAGVDVATVQRAMGHADPKTTTSYDRRGDDALREMASKL